MRYFVYIVECCDATLYTWITNDIEQRIHAHNHLKKGAKYTKTRRPVELVYTEVHESIGDAMKREIQIKKLKRSAKLKLIETSHETNV